MKKKNLLITSVLTLAVVTLVTAGCGRFHYNSPEKRADYIVDRISSELDLTDEQKNELNKIKLEVLVKMNKARENRGENLAEVQDLIKSDQLAKSDVEKAISRHEAKRNEMKPFLIEKIVEFHALLTPEQRIKVAEKIEEFHNKYHN